MKSKQAKKVLMMLDRIGQEIDVLGNIILQRRIKTVPVPVKNKDRFKIR